MTEYACVLDLVGGIDYNGGKGAQFAYSRTGNLARKEFRRTAAHEFGHVLGLGSGMSMPQVALD